MFYAESFCNLRVKMKPSKGTEMVMKYRLFFWPFSKPILLSNCCMAWKEEKRKYKDVKTATRKNSSLLLMRPDLEQDNSSS